MWSTWDFFSKEMYTHCSFFFSFLVFVFDEQLDRYVDLVHAAG